MAMIIIVIKLIITRVIILFVDNGRDHLMRVTHILGLHRYSILILL